MLPEYSFMWYLQLEKAQWKVCCTWTEEIHRHDILIISDNWIMRKSRVLVHVVGCNCTSISTVDDKQKSGAKIYCGWQLWVRRNFWHLRAQKLMWRQMTYQRVTCFLTLTSVFFQCWWCTRAKCVVTRRLTDAVHVSSPVRLIHEQQTYEASLMASTVLA